MTAADQKYLEDVRAIKALIRAFFNSINSADAKALQSHFFPSAGLTILRQDPPLPPESSDDDNNNNNNSNVEEGKLTIVLRTTIEKFVKLIEDGEKRRKDQPPGPVLHESPDLDATDIKIDALFATAWSPFKVTFDGVLHHYGTMAYTLCKTGTGLKDWKIEGLTQNYRRTPGWPEGHTPDFI